MDTSIKVLFVLAVCIFFSASNGRRAINDEKTALRIAESTFIKKYGTYTISFSRPLTAELTADGIWIVHGNLPENTLGGLPFLAMRQSDGAILEITHGR